MFKTFKQRLKYEIKLLRNTSQKDLTSIIISREDFRLLAKEISKHKNDFKDTIITIDDVRILASEHMPITEGIRFEPLQS